MAGLVTGLLLSTPVLAEPDASPSGTTVGVFELGTHASGSASITMFTRGVARGTRVPAGDLAGSNPASSQSSYWVREWRRRYKLEHRANRAHARMVRRLRRTLTVRARANDVIPGVWLAVASCESGQRWDYNGPSGFDGGLQFSPGTWSAYRRPGEPAYAYEASAWQQVQVAQRVLAVQGWGAWPACSARLGLR